MRPIFSETEQRPPSDHKHTVTRKAVYRVAFILLILLALGGTWGTYKLYNGLFNVIAESKDVLNLKVEEIPQTYPTRLKISGMAFNSAMGVRKITTMRKGSSEVVLVHLSIADRERGPNFAYELTIPDSVTEVCFGLSATPIWVRAVPSRATPGPPRL